MVLNGIPENIAQVRIILHKSKMSAMWSWWGQYFLVSHETRPFNITIIRHPCANFEWVNWRKKKKSAFHSCFDQIFYTLCKNKSVPLYIYLITSFHWIGLQHIRCIQLMVGYYFLFLFIITLHYRSTTWPRMPWVPCSTSWCQVARSETPASCLTPRNTPACWSWCPQPATSTHSPWRRLARPSMVPSMSPMFWRSNMMTSR